MVAAELMDDTEAFTRSAQMRLTEGDFVAIRRSCRQRGLSMAALLRMWVKERLAKEQAARIEPSDESTKGLPETLARRSNEEVP